ncbi:MAG: hypothetical protein KGJ59_05455 [Bacteroidota bacterium]|nr:hypothetical protein [Bacteroidota bacterium]
MKHKAVAVLIFLMCPIFSFSQTASQSVEETLTPQSFSDSLKIVWGELKNDADSYAAVKQSKGEFETTAEFQTRLEKSRYDTEKKMEEFLAAGRYADRTYSIWVKASLLRYDADAQRYTLVIATPISLPPEQQHIVITCAPNQYFSVTDSIKQGYKFSYLAFKDKDGFSWNVNESAAREAKNNERDIYFRVWLRFDFSQVFTNNEAHIAIVPVKLELVNKANNVVLWNDLALR